MIKEHIERAEKLADERDIIAQKEKMILSTVELISNLKEGLDVAIMTREEELEEIYNRDKTNKEFSNADKRHMKALQEPSIAKQKYDLKQLEHTCDVLKIEAKCELDKWKIQLELIRLW